MAIKENIEERIQNLRHYLKQQGCDAFIVFTADPHGGEYVPAHWKTREWISGFDGSAGTAVVTQEHAALWTDSRYFLAAEGQLKDTPFVLMKEGLKETPNLPTWLSLHLPMGAKVAVDAWTLSIAEEESLRKAFASYNLNLELLNDPIDAIWTERPSIPLNPVENHPLMYAGRSTQEKVATVREFLLSRQCDSLLVSKLDEVAWLCNIRGTDVPCCPLAVAYAIVTHSQILLYVDEQKLSQETKDLLSEQGITCRPYTQIEKDLATSNYNRVMVDPASMNCYLRYRLPSTCDIVCEPSIISCLKAIKNETEIQGFKRAMLRDGAAMVKFLYWLLPAVQRGGETELSISEKLVQFRSEEPLFKGISFDTIAGYASHGAIVHYKADVTSDAPLAPKGFLLLDSGAQYLDGTTDLTRTIPLGPLSHQEKVDYTLVLRGHIRLAMAQFPEGTSGTQLDICARYAMWQQGINYMHGTGHGVGAYLNVHEGPHQIRMNYVPQPIKAGMTVTDEPGIYRKGAHGVRIENTLLVVTGQETEFGNFLQFEPLTLCPIDTSPILVELMALDEIEYLNAYHQRVYEELVPLLNEEEKAWLKEATKPISK